MSTLAVHYSTGKDNWGTPADLVAQCQPFHIPRFTLDGAADATNHKLPRWWGPKGELEDFLATEPAHWGNEHVWLNPPYSRGMQSRFVRHAVSMVRAARRQGAKFAHTTILIPARTDTKLFHEVLWQQPDVLVRFFKGRITFVGAKDPAPFPSMLVTL